MSNSQLDAENPISLQQDYDYLAPDGSEIRLLSIGERANTCHCVLPAGSVSTAIRHRTVEELWYILDGAGEIWRAGHLEERIDRVTARDSMRIPVGVSFQFRAFDKAPLKVLIATMPPWPGADEAIPVDGHWNGDTA
jgi:mannose-6-phosphate isomerase-like protein (cupin superfamily)